MRSHVSLILSIFFSSCLVARPFNISRLGDEHNTIVSQLFLEGFEESYYPQTLDHFNYLPASYRQFQQRFITNRNHWKGAGSPILAFLGDESPLDNKVGLLMDIAKRFDALLVYIEHRFYGKSIPFERSETVFKDANYLGYLNSAQALADYAEVIIHVKETYKAEQSPVIVFGMSYSGSLAAWFRLKYPHITIGALASSAAILYFDDITPETGFVTVVSNDFEEASKTCYDTIRKSWSEIDTIDSTSNGREILRQTFTACRPFKKARYLKDYLLKIYVSVAQYNWPLLIKMCQKIDEAPYGEDTISRIYAGYRVFNERSGDTSSFINPDRKDDRMYEDLAWRWQIYSELVIPRGRDDKTMFEARPFDLDAYISTCKKLYNVASRPSWITQYHGGHDITLILKRFASNIIFSNGLRDPWSIGGVLNDISNTIVSVTSINGTHCQDLSPSRASDPDWLVDMRTQEINIMKGWIDKYNLDLQSSS